MRTDLLIFQIASLQPDSLDLIHQAIKQSEAIGACVVYAFGPKKVIRNLTTDTILPLRALSMFRNSQ